MDITPLLKSLQKDLLTTARNVYIKKDSVASGNTIKSLKVLLRSEGKSSFSLTLVGHEKVYYTLYGRGKGRKPPYDVLEKWADARGLNLSPKQIRGLQIKIAKHGTKKRYWGFYEDLEAELLPMIDKKLNESSTKLMFTADILNSFRL